MPNSKQRRKNRETAEKLHAFVRKDRCPNCGQIRGEKWGGDGQNGHFVPPCFGEPGFFVCEQAPLGDDTRER